MAKKTIFRENYLTHKPNGFTPDEYEKYGRKLDSHSFRKNINNEKENKEPQKESKNMAKNIIRLTEGDLHRIVKESVQRILAESVNEGQGWNLFKSTVDAANSDDFDYDGYKQHVAKDPKGWKQQQMNYIKYGNEEGPNIQKDAYNKYGDASDTMNSFKSVQGDDALPRINHSLRGKIGRAAGLGASKAYIHGKGMWDRFTHKGNPNEKLNFGG